MVCNNYQGIDIPRSPLIHQIGLSLDDAIERLGSVPVRDAEECCLPQLNGFEAEFERARNSDAVRFYLFRNGINWYYSLGFDADGRLVVTGEGQS